MASASPTTPSPTPTARGLLRQAVEEYRQAIKLQREAGFTMGTAVSHWRLGHTLHDLGRHEEARESWRESLDLLREARPRRGDGLPRAAGPGTPESIRNQL
ncbi:tetratricopeptide repeat protein [Nonomuraea sp. JJY05]|uniref:tetratricopeptide repeat protein n=1 Tax=Nonomuraea sp. JJY05 TaxID=3350255 RepID=UPI00373E8249